MNAFHFVMFHTDRAVIAGVARVSVRSADCAGQARILLQFQIKSAAP
jgi:hypothetical protein